MTGRLTLARLDPDRTPIGAWVAAAWAVLVDLLASGVQLEGLDELWAAFDTPTAGTVSEADRATWGLQPEQVAAQQQLLDGLGG